MFGASKRAIKRLLKDFEPSGSYTVEEVSKNNVLYNEQTFRAKFHDGSHEMIFGMESETVTVAHRNADGSVDDNRIQDMSFREYLADFATRLREFKANR